MTFDFYCCIFDYQIKRNKNKLKLKTMGASNFHNANASSIFAVTFYYEDEETNEMVYHEFGYDDLKDNLKYELESFNKPENSHKGIKFIFESGNDTHELRSYPSYVLGTLRQYVEKYKDIDIVINLVAVIRSAYYDGVNLDWDINIEINGCDYDIEGLDDTNSIIDSLSYYGNLSEKMAKVRAPQIVKHILKLKEKLVRELETIYVNYSDEYEISARFSNGETWYTKKK